MFNFKPEDKKNVSEKHMPLLARSSTQIHLNSSKPFAVYSRMRGSIVLDLCSMNATLPQMLSTDHHSENTEIRRYQKSIRKNWLATNIKNGLRKLFLFNLAYIRIM